MRPIRLLSLLLCMLMLGGICLPAHAAPQDIKHYLVLGQDSYTESGQAAARTDVLMIVSLDPAGKRVIFSSILRDSKITTPGGGENKINSVYRNHGYEGCKDVIQSHLGIDIEGTVIFDFDTIKPLIDTLGGVDIEISRDELNAIKSILLHRDPNMPQKPGLVHMSGRIALAYMRIRSVGNGDFGRTQRQRNVLHELMKKCKTLSLTELMHVYNVVQGNIHTDLGALKLLSAMQTAYPLMGGDIIENMIPVDGTFSYSTLRNSSILEVNWKKNRLRLADLLYPQALEAPAVP